MAYSFTKSRNSILLAKYVTGFCTSRSTGRGGVETVRAAFCSRATPPARLYPAPACTPSLFSGTWEHTESPRLIFAPLLRSCAAPFARVAPHPARTLRTSTVCFPGCTAHHSVPPPLARGPLACGPPLTRGPSRAVPLRTALPCRVPSLCVAPSARSSPCVHPRPSCASGMHAKGRVGMVGHPNGRCDLGGGDHREREGGHHPLCLPG